MNRSTFIGCFTAAVLIYSLPVKAELKFSVDQFGDGTRYIVVVGQFEFAQNIDEFARLARDQNVRLVTFASPGGNPHKAMELGRTIRRLGLATFQPRGLDCASACALAFIGGVNRIAEAGAIGIHKTTFTPDARMTPGEAAATIQALSAITVEYLKEMGVDSDFYYLSLKYESDDVRYLSRSEMTALRVTTTGISPPTPNRAPGPYSALPPSQPTLDRNPLTIPQALTGKLRHPRGRIALKAKPDETSTDLHLLQNGVAVTIIENKNYWYGVRTPVGVGYLHHTWVMVDQFELGRFDDRYIQIKSFQSYENAQSFVRSMKLPASIYLSTTGWLAVVVGGRYQPERAGEILTALKSSGAIPNDSFMTYGNSYVRRVCCN